MESSTSYQKGLTSIIVPIRFRPDLTRVCLDSVVNYTKDYELILVCDGIENGDFSFLNKYKATVLYNEKAKGFAYSVNRGFKIAKGEYVMELNSDTVVTPNWLERMLEELTDDVGLVAPSLPEEGPQSIENRDKPCDVEMVKGVCLMLRHDFMDKIGLLDESFGMGGGEDNDYCYRVRKEGKKVRIVRKSFIYHYNSASFRELFNHDAPYSKRFAVGQFNKFRRKWNIQDKPYVFIAIPNNGWIHNELDTRLIELTHDSSIRIHLYKPSGLVPHDNARNTCVKEFLETYCTHLLFIDNDIIPPQNALQKLLNANKDIIAPLCLTWKTDDNGLQAPCPIAHRYNEDMKYKVHYGKGIEETDVITGGMFLVKREVYEKIDRPFAFTYHTNGTVIYSEDFYFSQQCQKLGYKLYTHYELMCKHYKLTDIKQVNDLMVNYGKCDLFGR